MPINRCTLIALAAFGQLLVLGCSPSPGNSGSDAGKTSAPSSQPTPAASAEVTIDGSSTLGPMLEIAAELYKQEHPGARLNVRTSGTSSGFGHLLAEKPTQRIDICKASRPIAQVEAERAARLGIEFVELPVALDGIALVVDPKNEFCKSLTMAELKRIWEPGSKVGNWKDVRDGFPDQKLRLFGPGQQSGTFDVFTEKVNGKAKESRRDYVPSENDNVIANAVAGQAGALAYFGFAYFEASKGAITEVAIDAGGGKVVSPSAATIRSGEYPLARPLFLYVSKSSLARPEVRSFLEFFLRDARKIVEHNTVNSVSLDDVLYAAVRKRLADQTVGTVYTTPGMESKPLSELFLAAPKSAP